ncbi:DHA2 family efflux MFS transporter permease subunit [Streptomyces sp. AV19]|uniref:DHA2 family efflux MFS transporter permease subunit n=1 Tax=Streptomyces sp. AV19 TaxID=2793068 RepID=UPI0018FE7566|nr:DHA2 family efflux MFS transporter permease subunit [Streptomyces sp. AV19]MBH1934195.1 DHA2 family efflux MFS transporter permease subunit [Streptomyces sp. AV19]MDG4533542.1 DHA2 family efflux MFS transporter permease subunit [Streptomyces sp. AV19]
MLQNETGHLVSEEIEADPRRWRILASLVVSVVLVVLDTSIVSVALRTLALPAPDGLGASSGDLQWSVDAYTLVFATLLITAGLTADRFGRKRTLLAGLLLFGIFSATAAYAQDAAQLIASRGAMGIGAALVVPATLAIITHAFPPAERPRAIGLWAASAGLAIAIGPVTGGLLLEHYWWGSIFLVNLPVVLVGSVAVALVVPESADPAPRRFDPVGVLLCVAGLGLLVLGIVEGGELGAWTPPRVWANALGGTALLGAFVLWERRTSHPAMDLRCFRDARFSAAAAVVGVVFFGLLGSSFYMIFYLQSVRGYSSLQAGCCLLPLAAAQLVVSPASASAARRFGVRAVCAAGLTMTALTFFGVSLLDQRSPLWQCEALFFLMGSAMGLAMPVATASAMSTMPQRTAGAGAAMLNSLRQVAGALGVAVLGSLLSSHYRVRVREALAPLPTTLRPLAEESVEGALTVAGRLGATAGGDVLATRAVEAFVSAMRVTSLVAGGVTLVGAVVVWVFLPRKGSSGV